MKKMEQNSSEESWQRVGYDDLEAFVKRVLTAADADEASADAVSRSLVGASLRGVDSHGLRLLPHYVKVLQKGRINGRPQLEFTPMSASTGRLDADDAFGHLAGYRAIEEGITLADSAGMGAVSVINSSHFGAAGSYALEAAERGYLALVMSNSDKLVLAYDGVAPFHGTNPISFAAPVKGEEPYLLDMATSSIPYNRVLHYRSIQRPLPEDVAVDSAGDMTTDPLNTEALLPLGGRGYGYKGAGLAGLCEVLCSALTGMAFSHQLLAINGPDLSTPRHLGHFFLVMRVDAFIDRELYDQQLEVYLADLRKQESAPGTKVMAPGDREWDVRVKRKAEGIPVDPPLWDNLRSIAADLGVSSL